RALGFLERARGVLGCLRRRRVARARARELLERLVTRGVRRLSTLRGGALEAVCGLAQLLGRLAGRACAAVLVLQGPEGLLERGGGALGGRVLGHLGVPARVLRRRAQGLLCLARALRARLELLGSRAQSPLGLVQARGLGLGLARFLEGGARAREA